MQKCIVQRKPLSFLDIESLCLMLDNPVLWQHSRPIKVNTTWKSGFIPANCGTHSIYLVCKTSVKLVKKDKNESKWLQNFLNKSVQSKFLYGNLVLSQSTPHSPCVCHVLKGICFLTQKIESKKKVRFIDTWTVAVFVKVWHKKFFSKHVWSESKGVESGHPLWRHHWRSERHLQAASFATGKGKLLLMTKI